MTVTARDRVLIEIVTAANMAGVKEAEAGFLGMNPMILAAGAALGLLSIAGKSAMEIAKEQEAAEKGLTNALADRAAMAGKVLPLSYAAQAQITKAIQAHKQALADLAAVERGTYIPATHLSQLETMHLQDAQARVAATTGQARVNALRRLSEMEVSYGAHVHDATSSHYGLAAAQQKVADTAKALAVLQGTVGQKIVLTGINAAQVRDELAAFIQKNRDFITSQEDVVMSTTALVREGVSLSNLERDQMLILDLAAAKHVSLADATALVTHAEAGNFKGLKDLLGITTPAIKAGDTLAHKQKAIGLAMDIAAGKVRGASGAITDQQKAINDLKNDWHDFAVGPGGELDRAFTNALQIMDLTYQFLKQGGIQEGFNRLNNAVVDMIPGLREMISLWALANGLAGQLSGVTDSSINRASNFSTAAHDRGKRTPLTHHTVVVNVHSHGKISAAEANAIAEAIRKHDRSFS